MHFYTHWNVLFQMYQAEFAYQPAFWSYLISKIARDFLFETSRYIISDFSLFCSAQKLPKYKNYTELVYVSQDLTEIPLLLSPLFLSLSYHISHNRLFRFTLY